MGEGGKGREQRKRRVSMGVSDGIKDGRGEVMIEADLFLCYDSIFDGMPDAHRETLERFVDAHEATEPRIVTLEDFVTEFDQVVGLLGRLTREDAESFPAAAEAPARLTRQGVRVALAKMRATIAFLGAESVRDTIDGMVRNYRVDAAHPDREAGVMERHLRTFLCHEHDAVSETPVHGGAEAAVEHLLRRMLLVLK